ncbi:hypothetical protein B9Z55_016164 [Caenorhabditis nigoni]|uniref:Uncharacterized protein n=1 Tax=Caenorhabditis nigoni TaxID=1611254 RepID=A0A2G5UDF5_9PELO|nr:hypothetical protein B9Z55_016164 [Caenorhabditis nigoni]
MSSTSRPSSGNSAAGGGGSGAGSGGGGGGIRGFFSKLRKPSDQVNGSQQVGSTKIGLLIIHFSLRLVGLLMFGSAK